jgi:MFS family permease
MLVAVPALIAGWALAGFYGSLGPTLIAHLTGSHSPALSGLPLFILTASAALAVPLLKGTSPPTVMLIGTVALLTGVATTLLATTTGSEALFFTGTAIAGLGFGGCFQGAIRTIAPLAEPHERAGVLSNIYLASYVALGLPAILAGVLVADGNSILSMSREYSATIMLLAALAMLGLIVQRHRARPGQALINHQCVPPAAAGVPVAVSAAPDGIAGASRRSTHPASALRSRHSSGRDRHSQPKGPDRCK